VATTYTANLTTQYQLTTSNYPASGGGTMTPASGNYWYNAGTVVSLSETPATGFTFVNYTNTGGTLSGSTITMSGPATLTANFNAPAVNQTITSNPVGRTITVDSATCTTPCTYSWMPETVHTVVAAGPQAGATGVQYLYSTWSDGGTATQNILAPFSATVYTASFTTQYYLTTTGSPSAGGAVTPASGWYNSGTFVTVTGVPASGYLFTNFSGDLAGTSSAQTLVMSAPRTVNGYFGGSQTQTYATPGTFTWTPPAGAVSVHMQVWGGGGGGGWGENSSYDSYGGGGGGGGAYTAATSLPVAPGSSYTIVVGAGGGAGASGSGSSALGYSVGGGAAGQAATVFDGSGGGSGGAGGSPNGSYGGEGNYGEGEWYCEDEYCDEEYVSSWGSGGPGGASGSGGYTVGAGGSGGSAQVGTGYTAPSPSAGNTGQVLLTYAVTSAPLLTQTITSSPLGVNLTVDGTNCTTPCSLQWNAGSTHTIAAAAIQAGSTGTQYLFASWSDSGTASHTVSPSVAMTYTANLTTQYQLTTSNYPATGGTMTPASGNYWYNAGTVVMLSETQATGFTFANYANTGGTLSGSTITMSGPANVTANFTAPSVNQTIASNPVGRTITVDSATCTTPCTYSWMPGTVHTVVAAGPQAGAIGVQYVYVNWSDGGTATQNITAGFTPATYTANFTTQYYLTTVGSPSAGGTVTPASAWYNSGTVLTVTAVPASGYLFTNFSGDLSGTGSLQTLTMSVPRSVNGYFGGSQTQTYATAGAFTWTAPAGVVSAQLQIWGGGGGGGWGENSGDDSYCGGGGGGGGYTTVGSMPVAPGSNYTIIVGAGGGSAVTGSGSSALGYSAGGGVAGQAAAVFDGSDGGSGGAGGSPNGYYGDDGSYGEGLWYCEDEFCDEGYIASWGSGGSGGASGSGGYTAGAGGSGGGAQVGTGYAAPPPAVGNTGQVLLTYAVTSAPLLTQTITSSPLGVNLTVDGTNCTTPCSVQWNAGTSHTIAAAALQAGSTGTQYLFASWSDSGAASHAVAPSVATTYFASLTTQYQLMTATSPANGGTIMPANAGWFNAGTGVTLSETPANGFTFGSYSNTGGTLSGSTITVSSPTTVTANFMAAQTIAVGPLSNVALGAAPFSLTATASSGLAVSFASTTAGICTVSGTTVTLVSTGSCSITASQAGGANYLAAPTVSQAFYVTSSSQTLTFGPLSNVTYGTVPFGIAATVSSGLPVSLNFSTPAVCTVSSAAVTIRGAGTCFITASQPGNANFSAASAVTQSFTVTPAPTNVTMTSVGSATWALVYAKVARAADGSPVNSGVVWFYDNGILIGTGSVVGGSATAPGLTTSPGFHGYTAWFNKDGADVNEAANIAPTLSLTLSSSLQTQTISFSLPASEPLSAGTVALSASASSGLGISFTSNTPSVCTVSGSTATLVALGTCSITASQAGNANNAPASVTQTMIIGPAVVSSSLPSGTVSTPYNGTLTATGGAGGTYTWGVNGLPTSLSINPLTGNIAGTPLSVGTYSPITAQVQDDAGNSRTGPILPVHFRGTQQSPTPSSLTVNGANEGPFSGTVGGAVPFIFSYVSVPGARTVEIGCTGSPHPELICGPVLVLAPFGEVRFLDPSGAPHCVISWAGDSGNISGTITMDSGSAQFGSSTSPILTDSEGLCSVNPLKSSIAPPDGEGSPTVTLAITFNGATSGPGYTIESEWTDSGYDQMSNWGNLGNWTVASPANTAPQIASIQVDGNPVSSFLIGSAGQITISGQNLSGTTQITFGCSGVTIPSISSAAATQVVATYSVTAGAAVGPCSLTVITGSAQVQVEVDIVPAVTIWDGSGFGVSPSPGVPLGGTTGMSYLVQVSPASPSEPIVLSLSTTSGTGTAQFADGSSSIVITNTERVVVQGVEVSSTADNITLLATPQNSPGRVLAQQTLTVVNVILVINSATVCNTGYSPPCVAKDNDAANNYNTINGTQQTGLFLRLGTSSQNGPYAVCQIGIEFLGTVTPANYQGPVTLRRVQGNGFVYIAENLGQPNFLSVLQALLSETPGQDDTSVPVTAGGTGGAFPRPGGRYSTNSVYDLDAPGHNTFATFIDPVVVVLTRYNLTEFAALGSADTDVKLAHPVGNSISWFSRSSCQTTSQGLDPQTYQGSWYSFNTFYNGDNQSGAGTTNVSVNLQ